MPTTIQKDKLIQELGEYKVKYIHLEKVLTMNNKDDERLRKTTIAFLKEFADKGYENAIECIDWLEKQGKKPQGKSAFEDINEEKVDNQNCVKPTTDKVEPKFHEGDWVIHGHNILKIRCVGNEYYCIETVGGYVDSMLISEIDSLYHLWTIQDAKDGDVLTCNEEILLFKSYSVQGRIFLYCWYNGQTNNFHSKEMDTLLTTRNNICPTTKEQRDLLFQKMKEAGYECDADNKELRRRK